MYINWAELINGITTWFTGVLQRIYPWLIKVKFSISYLQKTQINSSYSLPIRGCRIAKHIKRQQSKYENGKLISKFQNSAQN